MKAKMLIAAVALTLFSVAPVFATTHTDKFSQPCSDVWKAVKHVILDSGKYGVISVDNDDMTASFNIGGTLGGKRTNSVVLHADKEAGCTMSTQTAFSGLAHNDAGDFLKRVKDAMLPATTQPTTTKEDGK
jgi:hypothetical protein